MNCSNCENIVSEKFCPNCGQKTNTHRITFKHFLLHDILHGVWHMEKGIFLTIREVLTRPGLAALDYITGKRIKYYNIFSLILLLLGVYLFINHYYNNLMLSIRGISDAYQGSNSALYLFAIKYEKPLMLLLIPMLAICSYFSFNKRKLNFAEHIIISGYVFAGYLLITIAGIILSYFNLFEQNFIEDLITIIERIAAILFIIFSYYQVAQQDYSAYKFGLSLLKFSFIFVVEVVLVLLIMYLLTIKK